MYGNHPNRHLILSYDPRQQIKNNKVPANEQHWRPGANIRKQTPSLDCFKNTHINRKNKTLKIKENPKVASTREKAQETRKWSTGWKYNSTKPSHLQWRGNQFNKLLLRRGDERNDPHGVADGRVKKNMSFILKLALLTSFQIFHSYLFPMPTK